MATKNDDAVNISVVFNQIYRKPPNCLHFSGQTFFRILIAQLFTQYLTKLTHYVILVDVIATCV